MLRLYLFSWTFLAPRASPNDPGNSNYTDRVVKLRLFELASAGRIHEREGAFVFQG